MSVAPFHTVGQTSKLVADYSQGEPWLRSLLDPSEPGSVLDRQLSASAIEESMKVVDFTESQQEALRRYRNGASVVVSGQQVGFLGGPLYTLYKIATAVSRCRMRATNGESCCCVFWIEDNDHDAREASLAYWLTAEQGAYQLAQDETGPASDKIPVAELLIDERDLALLHTIVDSVENPEYAAYVRSLLERSYSSGRSWTACFTVLLNEFFKDDGVLFLSAAVARRFGCMQHVVLAELHQPGLLNKAVQEMTSQLLQRGYHEQAVASELNVFQHVNRHRSKVQSSPESGLFSVDGVVTSVEELRASALDGRAEFSPSVLLRPIVQDYILGTTEYVAGPSEIAYLAQISSAYELYGVSRPRICLRSGATLITARAGRLIDKLGKIV